MIASLLFTRNALFFMSARENKQHPRRRKLALAFACAFATIARTTSETKSKSNGTNVRSSPGHAAALTVTKQEGGGAKRRPSAMLAESIQELRHSPRPSV